MSFGARTRFLAFFVSFNTARGIPAFIIPLYFVSVGIPIEGVGLALSVNAVSILVFELLWGFLIDRVDADRLMPWMVAVTAATYLLFPWVRSTDAAIAGEFLLGATAPAIAVVTRALIVRSGGSSSWARGFGLLGSLFSVSFMAGSLAGSALGYLAGFADGFYFSAAMSAGVYVVYRAVAPGELRSRSAGTAEAASPGEPRPRLRWSGLPLLGAVAVPTFMGLAFFTSLVQVVVTQTPSISASTFQAGAVVAAFYLSTAVFQPLLAPRGASRARTWIAVAVCADSGVFLALTQAHSIWAVLAASLAEGVCFATISPLCLSLLMVGVPKAYVGRMMGFYGAAEDVGLILGPLVGSFLWIGFGLPYAYLAFAAAFAAVLLPSVAALGRTGASQEINPRGSGSSTA